MYEDFTKKERELEEDIEAKNMMIYDPTNKSFDNRRRRVTDLNQCTRVTLPRPLSPEEASRSEVRKRTVKDTFEKYRRENTNKKGEMYLGMGREHTKKDKEIEWDQVREMERRVNLHTIAQDLMWRSGEDHCNKERIIKSRATRSGNQANLTLLYKDHKEGHKTRPVASGNESYNQGLSNGISEVLESVARGIENPYSVISSVDLLARAGQGSVPARTGDSPTDLPREPLTVQPGSSSTAGQVVTDWQRCGCFISKLNS